MESIIRTASNGAPLELVQTIGIEVVSEPIIDADQIPSDYDIRRDKTKLALATQSLPDSCPDCHRTQTDYVRDFGWRIGRLGVVGMLDLVEEMRGCPHDEKVEWAGISMSQA